MSARVRILVAGLLFSSGGALIKVCTFPPLERAGLRAAVAAVTLLLLLPETRRLPSWRVLCVLPAYFGATVLFVVANSLTTAANAIFLQSTAPFWIALLAPLLLRESVRRRDAAVLACIAVGMALFFVAPAAPSATAPEPRLGDLAALGSGLSYGLLLIGFRWLGRSPRDEQAATVAWGNALSAPAALLLAPVFGETPTLGDPASWAAIVALGTLQIGLAYALLSRALREVPAVQASALLMVEPAVNPLLTYAVHGERPAALAVVGGVVILAAVIAGPLLRRRAVGRGAPGAPVR